MVELKLHSDVWENERGVLTFLKSIAEEQVGPDDALLRFSTRMVKPGKGKAFLASEWRLELESKVRSLVVARWVIEKISEVSEIHGSRGPDRRLDDIGLALLIEDATKKMDRGPSRRREPPIR